MNFFILDSPKVKIIHKLLLDGIKIYSKAKNGDVCKLQVK